MIAAIVIVSIVVVFTLYASGLPGEWAYKRFRQYEQSMYWRRDLSVAIYKEQATDKMHEKLDRLRFYSSILGREP